MHIIQTYQPAFKFIIGAKFYQMSKRRRFERTYQQDSDEGQKLRKCRVLNDRSSLVNLSGNVRPGEPALIELLSQSQQRPKEANIDKVLFLLSEKYDPESLIARQSQQMKIFQFLETGVRNQHSAVPLVCGPPGIGKSLTINDTLKRLHSMMEFDQLEINMMRLKHSWDVYTVLLRNFEVSRAHLFKKSAQEILGKIEVKKEFMFENGTLPGSDIFIIKKPLVLVLEEIDTYEKKLKDQFDVIYNLLEWSIKPFGKLILIFVSNRTDFSVQLSRRIESRLGKDQIIFYPYSQKDMIRIIEFRLGPHKGLFTKSAIEFAAKKIAIKSTDIRKLLKLFQVSLENFMKLKQKFVTIEHIKETYNRMFANPIVTTISNLNKVVKGILSDILTEIKETKECWFDNLIQKSYKTKLPSSILRILYNLQQLGLIRMQKEIQRNFYQNKIYLNIEQQDLLQALGIQPES